MTTSSVCCVTRLPIPYSDPQPVDPLVW